MSKSQELNPGQEVAAHCHHHSHKFILIMIQEKSQEITVMQYMTGNRQIPRYIHDKHLQVYHYWTNFLEICLKFFFHYRKNKYSQYNSDGVVRKSPYF